MKKINLLLLLLLTASIPQFLLANGNIVIVNADPAGVGFNDPTPAVPVGGNTGTTLGQQRLNAFEYAATLWEAAIDSRVPIRIQANFGPLGCTATSATLGSAGARTLTINHDNARELETWYHGALADKQAGYDTDPSIVDLAASFNSRIGTTGCLQSSGGWYYGLDTNTPSGKINLVVVLLHEFAHGMGFSTFVNRTTGENIFASQGWPQPDIYEKRIYDGTLGMTWDQMSPAQRLASRVNTGNLAWAGSRVNTAAPSVLSKVALLRIDSPAGIAATHVVGTAEFGLALSFPGRAGQLVQAVDDANPSGPTTFDGCTAITNAAAVNGKFAFVNRGTCGFAVKVKNAQDAGAIGVIVGDNVASATPADMAGSGDPAFDALITIPAARTTLFVADSIRAGLASGAVQINLGTDPVRLRGSDAMGRVLLYAPNPFVSGSSVSHFDTTATRNLLMEPSINTNLTHSVRVPNDLTLEHFRDIGWYPDADVDLVEDNVDNCVNVDNPDQANNDGDALGDVCDPDDDNDGVLDGADNCPMTANGNQANYDGDAQGDACDADDDNDGVLDVNDETPNSDLRPTVIIGTCDSGAPNMLFPSGSTLSDRIAAIKASAGNRGAFVSAVNNLTNALMQGGILTGAQKGMIDACAARN